MSWHKHRALYCTNNLGGLWRSNNYRLVCCFLYAEGCILFGSVNHGHEVRWQSQSLIVNPICSPTCRAILTYRDRAENRPRSTGSGSTTPSPPSSEKPPTDPGWNTGAPRVISALFFIFFVCKVLKSLCLSLCSQLLVSHRLCCANSPVKKPIKKYHKKALSVHHTRSLPRYSLDFPNEPLDRAQPSTTNHSHSSSAAAGQPGSTSPDYSLPGRTLSKVSNTAKSINR